MRRAWLLGLVFAASAAAPIATVELGRKFTLRKGQTAALKGTNATVRVTGFVNSPCPKGARCIWSGQKVDLEFSVSGATVSAVGFPYVVKVVSSDYVSRATLIAARRS